MLVLEEFVRECRSRNLSLGLVYLPTPLQYDPKRFEPSNPMVLSGMIVDEQWLTTQSELQQRIAAWGHSNSVAHLDLTPFFREQIKEQPTLNWPLDGHWTVNGHAVASQAIAAWLEEEPSLSHSFLH